MTVPAARIQILDGQVSGGRVFGGPASDGRASDGPATGSQAPETLPEEDLSALAALEKKAFDDPWSAAAIRNEVGHSRSLSLFLRTGSRQVILAWACFRFVADEGELLRLAVAPRARRRACGRTLLEAGLAELRRRGARRCFLEVRDDNLPALELYRAAGFLQVGCRPGYYADGTAARLLALDLGEGECPAASRGEPPRPPPAP